MTGSCRAYPEIRPKQSSFCGCMNEPSTGSWATGYEARTTAHPHDKNSSEHRAEIVPPHCDSTNLGQNSSEERNAVFGDSRYSIVCNRCGGTNAATDGTSDDTKSESEQLARSATGPANSSLACAEFSSWIQPRWDQSSGQSSTKRFSSPARATASLRTVGQAAKMNPLLWWTWTRVTRRSLEALGPNVSRPRRTPTAGDADIIRDTPISTALTFAV
jgi:hypothetical protein